MKAALIDRDTRRHLRQPRTILVLGADLSDAREEVFCRMVCDGMSVAMAYFKAGFTAKGADLPSRLFRKPHIQARAKAILEARQTQGVVTLPEVTDMLKRVFAGALHDAEYSAAHNAAFSLARLYGHVTDRATLEVIRRPSRDPDAPSEMALASWVDSLPALPGPGPAALGDGAFEPVPAPAVEPSEASEGPRLETRAGPLVPNPTIDGEFRREINWLDGIGPGPGPSGPESEFPNEINGLEGPGPTGGRPENGAPARPVTGTPDAGAGSDLLGSMPPGPIENGAPLTVEQVPVQIREPSEFPSAEELFG